MSDPARISIGYIVPGHHLLPCAGPTRNVLSVAAALASRARVTVAFRRLLGGPIPEGVAAVPIQPRLSETAGPAPGDDAALRGVGGLEFLLYLHALRRFLAAQTGRFEVLLEKSWLLSGYVATACRRGRVPCILVENYCPPERSGEGLAKRIRLGVARRLAARFARNAALIVAESEELKAILASRWSIAAQRIEVVGLGVDRALFRPRGREEARRELGIGLERLVLLYVGVLDRTHDLRPLLEALRSAPEVALELHVVGDGRLSGALRQIGAECGGRVRFHGAVPHAEVPGLIAAADLCLAPYDVESFEGGTIGYSTLKIPEYLASGRPVASVPHGHILSLIRPGVDGFLLENEARRWKRFLEAELPGRERLGRMGEAAGQSAAITTWDETAERYLELCQRVRAAAPPRA